MFVSSSHGDRDRIVQNSGILTINLYNIKAHMHEKSLDRFLIQFISILMDSCQRNGIKGHTLYKIQFLVPQRSIPGMYNT